MLYKGRANKLLVARGCNPSGRVISRPNLAYIKMSGAFAEQVALHNIALYQRHLGSASESTAVQDHTYNSFWIVDLCCSRLVCRPQVPVPFTLTLTVTGDKDFGEL